MALKLFDLVSYRDRRLVLEVIQLSGYIDRAQLVDQHSIEQHALQKIVDSDVLSRKLYSE